MKSLTWWMSATQVVLAVFCITIIFPLAVFEMWSHRGYSTSPVKSTAQRYTVVLAVLMSAYFLNPFIKTGPACTDFIESLVYVKRISIDLLTSVVCLFYGTEIYFIFSDPDALNVSIWILVVRYMGIPVCIGSVACLLFNYFFDQDGNAGYAVWNIFFGLTLSFQECYILKNATRLERFFDGATNEVDLVGSPLQREAADITRISLHRSESYTYKEADAEFHAMSNEKSQRELANRLNILQHVTTVLAFGAGGLHLYIGVSMLLGFVQNNYWIEDTVCPDWMAMVFCIIQVLVQVVGVWMGW